MLIDLKLRLIVKCKIFSKCRDFMIKRTLILIPSCHDSSSQGFLIRTSPHIVSGVDWKSMAGEDGQDSTSLNQCTFKTLF